MGWGGGGRGWAGKELKGGLGRRTGDDVKVGWGRGRGWAERCPVHRQPFICRILSDVDTSGNVSTTTTSSDEDTASLVDFHSANRVPSPPTFDTPTPVDKPHPPHQICTSSQEPLVPPPQPHGTPCVPFSTHERSRPPNDPPPSDQTRPSNEPHPLDQAHSTAESFTQTCPSDGSLQERGGVEAWRTPDSIKEVHVVMSSLVEYTSPPPRPHPLGEAPSVGHNQPPVKVSHANGSSRRCWVRSADKGIHTVVQ